MLEIMKTLGYTDNTLVKKTRNTYTFDCFEIVIDQVKNLGLFIEVELKIEVANAQVGIKTNKRLFKIYRHNKVQITNTRLRKHAMEP